MSVAHDQPLKDQTVLLPEGRQLAELAEVIRGLGGRVQPYRLADGRTGSRTVERWLAELAEGEYDDVVFATAQGVHLLVEFAAAMGKDRELAQALRAVRIISLGAKPARALSELGVAVAVKLSCRTSDALLAALPGLEFGGRVVGLQHWGPVLDPRVAEYLESIGATPRLVSNAPVGDPAADEVMMRLSAARGVSIVFTGITQVTWLFEAASAAGKHGELIKLLNGVRVVATESVAERLRELHIAVVPVPSRSLIVLPRASDVVAMLAVNSNASIVSGTQGVTQVTAAGESKMLSKGSKRRVVVIGNGMVGYRFCERLREYDTAREYEVVTFAEEPRPAYDRVHLTSYFETRDPQMLSLADHSWYEQNDVLLKLGVRVTKVDRRRRVVVASDGTEVAYDVAVMATGSTPFVPPVPGMDKIGVFVYRTIEDLEAIIEYSKKCKRAAVMGGGLLGLEAAKAVSELGLDTHVVEFAPRLMPRQLDAAGARVLADKIQALGVKVHLDRNTARILGEETVTGIRYADGERLDVDMIVVSAGIRPRDDLARDAGINVGERGGIVVDDGLATSDPDIFAVGECALHRGMIYGLVGPGYEMADVVAQRLTGRRADFSGADMSTKLKLMGVDVASFGEALASSDRAIVFQDSVKGVYKKLILSEDGQRLLGGSLVGEADEYARLLHLSKSGEPLGDEPESLILGVRGGEGAGAQELPDAMQVCSCNNVTKGEICLSVRDGGCDTLAKVKTCTKAGSGCGGCMPLVTDIFNQELRRLGHEVRPVLCEHFSHTRQELFHIVQVRRLESFDAVMAAAGNGGSGCEVCKPTIASILASVVNHLVVRHDYLQDTNDRFLANIQRQGTYSVVPRIPGGEITPERLIAIGEVAKKYDLYTKITGGQRIDLFGARVNQLPDIWEDLGKAGFESGHAYGKALRTVKSCVGSTWCRFGVQDSVGMAVRVENRYKGIRSPHKLKSAVSGCVRECAEAQSKDFGLIATENGYNVYVGGNGGAKPRHADLLVADVSAEDAIRYLDRFIMYYIATADKLTRTSVWLEKLEGGIEQLRRVVLDDSLGIAEQLERDMQHLVDTYHCEWAEVVKDPTLRARFRHFVNSEEGDENVTFVPAREMHHPRPWTKADVKSHTPVRLPVLQRQWVRVGAESDFPREAGMSVQYGRAQIAVFNFSSRGQWYAVQNKCPHRKDMVLARGIVGDAGGTPKVACPLHKKTFSLEDGTCLSGDDMSIATFPVKVEAGSVWLELPAQSELDAPLGPESWHCLEHGEVADTAAE